MLTIEDPSPDVLKQKHCMEYILRSVLEGHSAKDKRNMQRLNLLVLTWPPQSFALLASPELQRACAGKDSIPPGMAPGSVKFDMALPSLALLAPPGVNDHVEHKGYNNIPSCSGGDSVQNCLLWVIATFPFWASRRRLRVCVNWQCGLWHVKGFEPTGGE